MGEGFEKTFLQKEDRQMTKKYMAFHIPKLFYVGKLYIKNLLEIKEASTNRQYFIRYFTVMGIYVYNG